MYGIRSWALGALFWALLIELGLGTGLARAATPPPEPVPPAEQSAHFDAKARVGKKDIFSLLRTDGHFETLVKAINSAGLSDLFRMRGPLTVFVPTDEAFAKLAPGELEHWLKDPQKLKRILRYHVLRAYVPAKQVARLRNALTVNGNLVRFDVPEGTVGVIHVNDATVTQADILAVNGVVHAIDRVLMPPEPAERSHDRAKKGAPSAAEPEKADES